MENMIDNYISVLQKRRKYFTEEELSRAADVCEKVLHMNEMRHMNDMIRMDEQIQQFVEFQNFFRR